MVGRKPIPKMPERAVLPPKSGNVSVSSSD
jgi:hypothetical protein